MSPLISVTDFFELSESSDNLIILDCRSDLSDSANAVKLYNEGHILNAIHAHLEDDLSGPIIPGKTSRHPLPSKENWQATLQRWGVEKSSTVVVYDQSNNMFSARAWWMLRWAGITNVLVLDGGLNAWLNAGHPISTLAPSPSPSSIQIELANWVITAEDIPSLQAQILDARALPRYAGETEPLDGKAGHIPSAQNADFSKNLTSEGFFQPKEVLHQRFAQCRDDVVCYCGSGVTACHNILAFDIAGLPMPKLYAGSWSEWITDPNRPIATGIEGEAL
ncbi:sulfurtransferase [Reinekea forsetii]|nr:sulfurtransferase [Reinekea forsetii]